MKKNETFENYHTPPRTAAHIAATATHHDNAHGEGEGPTSDTEALRKAAFSRLLREGVEANPGMWEDNPEWTLPTNSGTLNPLDYDIREGSPGHDGEDPYDGTIFPVASSDQHQEEHDMHREMTLRLREARRYKERRPDATSC